MFANTACVVPVYQLQTQWPHAVVCNPKLTIKAKLDTFIPAEKMAVHLRRPSNCKQDVCVRMVCARNRSVLQQNGVVVGHLHATRKEHATLAKNVIPDMFMYRPTSLPH